TCVWPSLGANREVDCDWQEAAGIRLHHTFRESFGSHLPAIGFIGAEMSAAERLEHLRRTSEAEEIQRRKIRRAEEEERQRTVKLELQRMEEDLAVKRNGRPPLRQIASPSIANHASAGYNQSIPSPRITPLPVTNSPPPSDVDVSMEFRPLAFDPPSYKPGMRDPTRPYLHPAEVEAARRVVGSPHSRSRSAGGTEFVSSFLAQEALNESMRATNSASLSRGNSRPSLASPQAYGAAVDYVGTQTSVPQVRETNVSRRPSASNTTARRSTPGNSENASPSQARPVPPPAAFWDYQSNTSAKGQANGVDYSVPLADPPRTSSLNSVPNPSSLPENPPNINADVATPSPPPRRSRARSVGAAAARQQKAAERDAAAALKARDGTSTVAPPPQQPPPLPKSGSDLYLPSDVFTGSGTLAGSVMLTGSAGLNGSGVSSGNGVTSPATMYSVDGSITMPLDSRQPRARSVGARRGNVTPPNHSQSPLPTPPTSYHHPAPTFPVADGYIPPLVNSEPNPPPKRNRGDRESSFSSVKGPLTEPVSSSRQFSAPYTELDSAVKSLVEPSSERTFSPPVSPRSHKKSGRSRSGGGVVEGTAVEEKSTEQESSTRTRARSVPASAIEPGFSSDRSSRGTRDKIKPVDRVLTNERSYSSLDRPKPSSPSRMQPESPSRPQSSSPGRSYSTTERLYESLDRPGKSSSSGRSQSVADKYGSLDRQRKGSGDKARMSREQSQELGDLLSQGTNSGSKISSTRGEERSQTSSPKLFQSSAPPPSTPLPEANGRGAILGSDVVAEPSDVLASSGVQLEHSNSPTNPPNSPFPPPGAANILPPTKRPVARPGARAPTQAFRDDMREASSFRAVDSATDGELPSQSPTLSPRLFNRRASQPALASQNADGVHSMPVDSPLSKEETSISARRTSQPAAGFGLDASAGSTGWESDQSQDTVSGLSAGDAKRKWTVAMPPPLATASRGGNNVKGAAGIFANTLNSSNPDSPASVTASSESQPPSPTGENAEITRLRAGLRRVTGDQNPGSQKEEHELDQVRLRRAGEDGALKQIDRPRTLWLCRGKRRVWVTKVVMNVESLSDSDCLILDDPPPPMDSGNDRPDEMGATSRLKEAIVWVFFGKDAGTVKRSRAIEVANRWNALENIGRGKVMVVDQSNGSTPEMAKFVERLSSRSPTPDAHPPIRFPMPVDDAAWDAQVDAVTTVYEERESFWVEIQKGAGLSWKAKGEGVAVVRCVDMVYLWQPTRSSAPNVHAAMDFARSISDGSSPDPSMPLPLVMERQARESPHFRERFIDFPDKGGATLEVKKQGNVVLRDKLWGVYDRGADVARSDKIDPLLMLRGHEPIARWDDNELFKMIDAGLLEIRVGLNNTEACKRVPISPGSFEQVWLSTTMNVKELPSSEHGIFYSSESYIIYYRYRDGRYPQLEKDASVVFFWQGRTTLQKDQGTAALLVAETYRGKDVRQLRVEQDREPPEFLGAFGGFVVVRKGQRAMFDPSGRRLYQVYRSGAGEGIRVSEIAVNARSLSPWDSFVMTGKRTLWVWHGKGSSKQQIALAKKVARERCGGDPRPVNEVHQGAESADFWEKIGAASKNPGLELTSLDIEACKARDFMGKKFDEDKVVIEEGKPPKGWRRRLWKISHVMGAPSTEEIRPFQALDLEEESVYILDAWTTLYVWIGARATTRWKDIKEALDAAESYCGLASSDENSPDRLPFSHAYVLRSGQEPKAFTDHFLCWDARVPPSPTSGGSGSFKSAFGKMGSIILGTNTGHAVHDDDAIETVESLLTKLSKGEYSLEELKAKDKPLGLDPANMENYLIATEFKRLFGMEKPQFLALPQWKKTELKKKADFF
ncbi:hypothetical protein HDU93_008516, partial [Gonapodya sp. JEL0774]